MPRAKKKAPSLTPLRSVRARVRRFIRDHDLVRAGNHLLAGVSGGPDSTCLLLTLAALRRSLGFTLHAAHFDHRLRGVRAAACEERFVRSLTEALGVPLRCGAGEVRTHARNHKRSLEEAARELRYRFLAQAASDAGCQAVAVGHTRDDQAETLLLHLLRGSGLRGLAAMAPSTPWPVTGSEEAPRLVRPLLCLSREDTEVSCREAGLVPLQDPSNRSQAHLRNRIRGELLPLLRRYNPRVDDALLRLADAAAADVEVLEALAAGALAIEPGSPESSGSAGPGAVRLSRRELASLPPALQHHAVRLAVARLLGDARGLADHHVRSIVRANEGPTGARLDLPRGLRAEVERKVTVLSKEAGAAEPALPEDQVPLPVPGDARLGPWRVQAEVLSRPPANLSSPHDPCLAFLDADACGDRLFVRRSRRGDRFHPLGLPQPKKLQDFFVDGHVARPARDALPLVCGERGIAWVVTQRPAEWAKVTAATNRVLHLRAARTNS